MSGKHKSQRFCRDLWLSLLFGLNALYKAECRICIGIAVNGFDLIVVGLACCCTGVAVRGSGEGLDFAVGSVLAGGAVDFVLHRSSDGLPGQLGFALGSQGDGHIGTGQVTGAADPFAEKGICVGIAVDGLDFVVVQLACRSTGIGVTGIGCAAQLGIGTVFGGGTVDLILCSAFHSIPGNLDFAGGGYVAGFDTGGTGMGRENPLEKEMTTHFSILAWKIPQMEDPGRL